MPPSEWLHETLHRNTKRRLAYYNEKSHSESIVSPILTDLLHQNNFSFLLSSGAIIEGDKHLELNGECDFVLSKVQRSIELERPVFCIVAAKDNDIELEGFRNVLHNYMGLGCITKNQKFFTYRSL